MPPIVSVIIPVFNRPTAVRRAIESVLAQTFGDLELIVVDDGSTDATPDVVARMLDPRITLLRTSRNRGASAARNAGINHSAAPYVAFLDSDDEWLPTKLERQLRLFERGSERLGLVYAGTEQILPDGKVRVCVPRRWDDLRRMLLTENVVGETSIGMVRRVALERIGGFDETLPALQDMDLWLRICEEYDADFVPAALARIRKDDDRGRISLNVASSLNGRDQFRRKHREKLVRSGVLHLSFRESGWWSLREARDAARARGYYLESAVAKPFAPITYGLLLMACVPAPCLDFLASWKERLLNLRRPRAHESVS